MRTCGFLGSCAALLLVSAPAWSATTPLGSPGDFIGPSTVINFDTYPHGTAANTLYAPLGVEFRYDALGSPVPIIDWADLGRQTTSPPNVLSTEDVNGSVFSQFLDLIFDTPQPTEVGAYFGNDQGLAEVSFLVELSVFDQDDLLLGLTTVQTNQNTSVDQFIGIRSDTPIARARFEYLSAPFNVSVTLDDVRFSPIPEPATGLLLALGLVGLAGRKAGSAG